MPRNMSFMLTTDQIRNQTKTVTRRLGWKFLKAGDIVNACVKCQGIPKGQKVERICQIKVTKVSRVKLYAIHCYQDDVSREGFPMMRKSTFVAMYV